MKKLKRKVLFCLACEYDFFNIQEGFKYQPYKYLYCRLLNYSQSSIRDAVLQLVGSGEVDKIVRDGVPLFRLTSQGRQRLLSFFTISIGQKRVWDRIWRIALITKKIKKVNNKTDSKVNLRRFRKKLRNLGFKKFTRGVYISPLPVSNKIKDFSLENSTFSAHFTVIESRRLLLGDNEQLANEVWDLNSLFKKYQNFITEIRRLLKKIKHKKRLLNHEKNQFSLLLNQYFSLLEQDPGLPRKILPKDWPAEKAKELFIKLNEIITSVKNNDIL